MNQFQRQLRWTIAIAISMFCAIAGISSESRAADSVLRVNMGADLRIFDPVVTTSGITRRAAWLNYDFLFSLDADNSPKPQMVDTYTTSADGLTHTFTLRAGMKFHDGTPVTAEDAVASIERWAKRDDLGKMIAKITTSMTAVDATTFTIVMSEKYTKLPDAFAKITPSLPIIVPKRLAASDPNKPMPETIGSGPYRFVPEKFVPGSIVVYERFKDYIPRPEAASMLAGGKRAYFDRIEVVNITDTQTAVSALQNGEIDFLLNPQFDFLPILEADKNIKVEVTDKFGRLGYVRMNWLQPPFDDIRARRAVQHLVNQVDFLNSVAANPKYYAECSALYVCGSPWAYEDKPISFDVAKAKQLLKEAGYAGQKVALLHLNDLAAEKSAGLVLAQALRAAGITVEMQEMDFATFGSRTNSKAPVNQGGWSIYVITTAAMMIGDPLFVDNSAGCDAAARGWPCDPVYEELRAQFAKTDSRDAAKEIARKLQLRGSEIVLHVPYGVVYFPIAYRADIEGVIAGPATEVFWNMRRKAK